MFDGFFGSKYRFAVLVVFFNGNNRSFLASDIVKLSKLTNAAVKSELQHLQDFGLLISSLDKKRGKYYYSLNKNFLLYSEVHDLVLKMQASLIEDLLKKIGILKSISLLILTDKFLNLAGDSVDLLIVGKLDKKKILKFITRLEKEFNRNIEYTVFSHMDFEYRYSIADKFLHDILIRPKLVLINKSYDLID